MAEMLGIKPIEVYEVSSFYTMFNLKPVGKHVLEICRTGPCMLRGSDELTEHLERITGAKVGGTSPDGIFTLKEVECLAACGFAPVVQVREKYYEQLDTPEAVDAMLNELKQLGAPSHSAVGRNWLAQLPEELLIGWPSAQRLPLWDASY